MHIVIYKIGKIYKKINRGGYSMYTVLIVEDEILVSTGLKNMVQWSDMDMVVIGEARNGKQGLDMYQKMRPDIILTDIRMPVMNGLDMIKHIREKDSVTKIIVLTCYEDFELVLVDDGSPDGCPKLCDDLAAQHARVQVIHRENGGLSAARNTGIEWALSHSDSEWITFIDSDDWVHPQYLESMLRANEQNGTSVCMGQFCFTEDYTMETAGDPLEAIRSVPTEEAFQEESLDPNSACARLYKKESFREIRYPVGKLHEDRFTTYKVLFQFKEVSVVAFPLYYYFVNQEGIVRSNWSPRKLDNVEACEQQLAYFEQADNREMVEYILKDYLHLIRFNLKSLKGKDEFSSYEKLLRTKLRRVLKTYKKRLGLSFSKDYNTYKYAYPLWAKVVRKMMK